MMAATGGKWALPFFTFKKQGGLWFKICQLAFKLYSIPTRIFYLKHFHKFCVLENESEVFDCIQNMYNPTEFTKIFISCRSLSNTFVLAQLT